MVQSGQTDEGLPLQPLPPELSCLLWLCEEALQAGQELMWGRRVGTKGLEQWVPTAQLGQRRAMTGAFVEQLDHSGYQRTRACFACSTHKASGTSLARAPVCILAPMIEGRTHRWLSVLPGESGSHQ